MNDQDERAEICKNCLMFRKSDCLCKLHDIPTEPEEYCGDFLDKQEFREEML